MRKILSVKEEEKKNRRNQMIIGLILIFVMLFGTIGYAFQGDSENPTKVKYNGFEFNNNGARWILNKEGINFAFSYNPKEINRIPGEINKLDSYTNKPLYFYSADSLSLSEIYSNLVNPNQLVLRMQEACLEGKECLSNSPIKKCNEDNILIISESEISKIVQDKKCVYIEGKKDELIKITDEFLFKILEVTP